MKKFLFIFSGAVLLLLVATQLYVRSDHFAVRLRPLVLAPLQEVLGNGAQIGWIRANFLPMYIEARDIMLPDEEGRPAAAIRKIRISINPVPLLLKKVRLPSIQVVEPRILAVRSRAGEVNILPLIERIRSNVERSSSRAQSDYQVLLKIISVTQGNLTFQDEESGVLAAVSGLQSSIRVNVDADAYTWSLRHADISVRSPSFPELKGQLKASVRYARDGVRVDELELSAGDTECTATGTVGPLPDPTLDLHFKARSGPLTLGRFLNMLKSLKRERRPTRLDASANVTGRLSAPVIEGKLQASGITVQGTELKEVALAWGYRERQLTVHGERARIARAGRTFVVDRIDASALFSDHGIDISKFEVEAGDLSIVLSGRADPGRGFDAAVSAGSRGKGQVLSALLGFPVEGNVSIKGNLTGALTEPLFDGTVAAGPVSVRGIMFDSAAGRIQYRDLSLRLASIDVHQQGARFFFNGSVDLSPKDPVFDARLRLVRADVGSIVALFYEPLPLFFTASGELAFSGTMQEFTGTGRLMCDAGSAYGESFTRGTVTATLTRDRISFPEVSVDKGSGTIAGSGWIGFNSTYAASLHARGIRLKEVQLLGNIPVDGAFDLSIESSGSFSRPLVRSNLVMDEVLLDGKTMGSLHTDLQIADKVLNCSARLADDAAVLTGRMSLNSPYPWSGHGTFSLDGFDPFEFAGKKDMTGLIRTSLQGSVSARGQVSDGSSLAASLQLGSLSIQVGDYVLKNDGPASLSMAKDRITVVSMNLVGADTRLAVTGNTGLGNEMDLSLRGSANLSLLKHLIKELEYSSGTADVKVSVTDAWTSPDVSGEVSVRGGEVKVKDIPQRFSALNGKLVFDRSRVVVDSLKGEIGGGTLNASGKVQLSGFAIQDFSTRVNFDNVTVRYPEGLTSTLSGALFYDGDRSEQSLTGDVQLKRARYDKRVEWKSMLVDIGRGFTQRKKAESLWIGETQLNIRFFGNENILFQNNLAKVPLDVDMFVRGTVNRPQLLGRVEARKGTVFFRQNEFKIVHASADFVDPGRINPVLDVQAEIQVREYLVRLAVSGTADHAVVTLLSDPSLQDSDILALLALGKTSSELKGKEAGVGMSEAASFATGKFQDMFESRARSLTGLDRFQVDPYVSKGDTSVPRVTVGKEIVQDKLYLTYSSNVGSTTPEQIFRIEYILNRHFSLVGERNELGNTGADIKYRFEFK